MSRIGNYEKLSTKLGEWGDKLIVVRADDLHQLALMAQELEERSNFEELVLRRAWETLKREQKK